MKEAEIRTIKLFQALCNPTRYKILKMLSKENMLVADIIKKTRKTKSAVSQHLRILRNLDLVKYHRENDKTVYQIKKGDVLKNIYKIENFYIRLLNK